VGVVGQRVMVQPQMLLAPGAQTGPAMLPSAQIIETVAGAGVGHFSGGQIAEETGTQAHTDGELSKVLPWTHSTFSTHEQSPEQSAPPAAGSQLSFGLSTHLPRPGHGVPANPPHETPSEMHLPPSQCVPAAHFTAAQGSVGGGLHWQVGQPLASSTFPYWQ